jgi:hypothetical protein
VLVSGQELRAIDFGIPPGDAGTGQLGGNVFANEAGVVGLEVDGSDNVVHAYGNRWIAGEQEADATGHYLTGRTLRATSDRPVQGRNIVVREAREGHASEVKL